MSRWKLGTQWGWLSSGQGPKVHTQNSNWKPVKPAVPAEQSDVYVYTRMSPGSAGIKG